MSVINKMLKDLDDRQENADVSAAGQYTAASSAPSSNKKSINATALLLAGILLVLTVLVWHLIFNKENTTNDASELSKPMSVAEQADDPAAELEAKPDPSLELAAPPPPEEELVVEDPQTAVGYNQTALAKPESGSSEQNTPSYSNLQQQKMQNENLITAQKEPSESPNELANVSDVSTPAKETTPDSTNAANSQLTSTLPQPTLSIKKTTAQLTPEQHVEKLMVKAEDAYDKGYITEAIEQLTKVLAISDSHIEARNLLAAAWYGRGESARAITIINDGLQRYPMIEAWRLTAAKIFFKENNIGGAFSYLDVDLSNASKEFYTLKGNLARELKDFAKAEQAYSELTAMEPSVGSWWLGLAIAQDSQNKVEPALASYKKVMMTGGVSRQSIEFSRQRIAELEG